MYKLSHCDDETTTLIQKKEEGKNSTRQKLPRQEQSTNQPTSSSPYKTYTIV